jgi:glycosyltransferase involved in cell wall biosynthesis
MKKKSISAIIITKNEEFKIKKCIESVLFCNEIVIVDNGSTDKTLEIATQYGCKILKTNDWPGFGKQKQRALELATSEWILSLDADEVVSEQLRKRLEEIVSQKDNVKTDAYKIYRVNKFLGKELRHGGWGGDVLTRFGKRENLRFTEDQIHESLLVSGTIGFIEDPLYHEARENLGEVLEKQARYITMQKEKQYLQSEITGPVTAVVSAFLSFFNYYIIKGGFLDGAHGFFAAASKAQGKFWKKSGL